MAKKSVKKSKKKSSGNSVVPNKEDNTLFAWLASFLTIVGFIIALVAKKEDDYVMFYAKHGLILFIGQLIAGALASIPFIGWFFFGPIFWILWIVLWAITWINALSGEKKRTWLITDIAEKIDL